MQKKIGDYKKGRTRAEELAKEQKAISISEFFLKNRHLLGFDNPRRALLTTIKEGIDNSLDACEEMKVLPEIKVEVTPLKEGRYRIIVEDNGPGIVKEQIPNIFAKLLYGSKFHSMKCSRGQQGIGISASVMYGQLTTGKAAKIVSKTGPRKKANYYELQINTKTNEPEIINESVIEWDKKNGTKIELEIEAEYVKGQRGIDEYLKQTAISNPHANIEYINPEKQKIFFPRVSKDLPREPKEIKPHPYGVELGMLISMLKETKATKLQSFLINDFCRVSPRVAKEICKKANLYENARPNRIARQEADNLFKAIKETKIMSPPTNCLVPIGEDQLLKGLKKEVNADFYVSVTRPPSVYRGNPFQVEVSLAYGGNLPSDNSAKLIRFANRVPLQYQQSSGAISKSVIQTAWRNYGISQSRGSLPAGPLVIVVHMASVWVPFTSESKEAIALYPEILKEMKLGLQEAGRKLSSYIRRTVKAREQKKKIDLFEKYIPELASALANLTGEPKTKIKDKLERVMKKEIKQINMIVGSDK